MRMMRLASFVVISFLALAWGALFAYPIKHENFARVAIGRVSLIADIADSVELRTRGLAGRISLAPYQGMLFIFDTPGSYAIWMKGMTIPIDIFWIRDGVVVDLQENVPPPAPGTPERTLPVYTPDTTADYVLETNAGFAKKHAIHIGDRVTARVPYEHLYTREGKNARHDTFQSNLAQELGKEYFIETLRSMPPQGDSFQIGEVLEQNNAYTKYHITYRSGAFTISGIMNVPSGDPPPQGFPVLILNHGLISPEIYFSGRGSRREQDYFARHGYVTVHPDYRGLASSTPTVNSHHDFYVGYTQDVIHCIDALKQKKMPYIDVARLGMWGHSMGGGIAARVMVLRPEVRAFVLFAPISADTQDNFFELPPEEISYLEKTYGTGTKATEPYNKISPINFFQDVASPVQLHHGIEDQEVPIMFSEKMYSVLTHFGKKVEFYKYPDERHEFADGWSYAAKRALQFFDTYVKK